MNITPETTAELDRAFARLDSLLDDVTASEATPVMRTGTEGAVAEKWHYSVKDDRHDSGNYVRRSPRTPVHWAVNATVCVSAAALTLGALWQTDKGWPSFAHTFAEEDMPNGFSSFAGGAASGAPDDSATGSSRGFTYPKVLSSGLPEARSTTSRGEVVEVSTAEELLDAAKDVPACGTIALASGRYEVPSLRIENIPGTADCPVTIDGFEAVIVGTDPLKPAVVLDNAPYLVAPKLTIEGGADSLQIIDSDRVRIGAIETSGAKRAGVFITGSNHLTIPEGSVHTSAYGIVVGAFPEDMGTTMAQTVGVELGEELRVYDTTEVPLVVNAGASANYFTGVELDAMMVADVDSSCGVDEGVGNVWSDTTCINPGGAAFKVRSNNLVEGSGEKAQFYANRVFSDLPTPWAGMVVEIEIGAPYDTTLVSCSNSAPSGSKQPISNKPCQG